MTGQEHADPWADSETPERVPLPVRPQPYDSPGVWVERAAASSVVSPLACGHVLRTAVAADPGTQATCFRHGETSVITEVIAEPASGTITSDVGTLRPAENMALTAARAQLERGENPPRSTTAMLVAIVERLAGIRDYADDAEDGA